jgi:hypothetical protein
MQNDKRALETAIVVEGGAQLKKVPSGRRDSITSAEEGGELGCG